LSKFELLQSITGAASRAALEQNRPYRLTRGALCSCSASRNSARNRVFAGFLKHGCQERCEPRETDIRMHHRYCFNSRMTCPFSSQSTDLSISCNPARRTFLNSTPRLPPEIGNSRVLKVIIQIYNPSMYLARTYSFQSFCRYAGIKLERMWHGGI
jgi:hypothetical protein